ncbi:MAG: ATP-grasp domain-containing protein [Rhodocyclaceae bacterium]
MTIALITDEPNAWHSRELKRAFARLGHPCRTVDLRRCRFDLSAPGSGLVLPGFTERVPDAAFVRGVPGGSLEQVVLRLDFLHGLRELGVPVYNEARAIERSVDKAMTSFLLHRAGVPTPPTWATEDAAAARRVVMRTLAGGDELVTKPLFGSQGKGLRRLAEVPADPPLLGGVAYLQRWVPPSGEGYRDWRVLVVGQCAVAAMRRESEHWITNVAQGARPHAEDLTKPENADLAHWAVRAAGALGMDYAGVDLMRDGQGKPWVIEVNGIPAWRGLQRVTTGRIADLLARDLVQRRMGKTEAPSDQALRAG